MMLFKEDGKSKKVYLEQLADTRPVMKRGPSLLGRFLFSAGFLGLFVGAVLLARMGMLDLLSEKHLSAESCNWEITQGTVISSSLDKDRRGSPGCHPRITYRYQVAGKTYESNRVSFQQSWLCYDAEMAVNSRPVNGPVEVHYRPGDPAEAVLLPATWDGEGFFVFIVIMMSILLYAALILAAIGLLGLMPMSLVRKLFEREPEDILRYSFWLFPLVFFVKVILLPFTCIFKRGKKS